MVTIGDLVDRVRILEMMARSCHFEEAMQTD